MLRGKDSGDGGKKYCGEITDETVFSGRRGCCAKHRWVHEPWVGGGNILSQSLWWRKVICGIE